LLCGHPSVCQDSACPSEFDGMEEKGKKGDGKKRRKEKREQKKGSGGEDKVRPPSKNFT